jgi:uncharacterized lipoprotein YmbA
MMRRLLAAAMLLGLAACASDPAAESWVEGSLSSADSKMLAETVAQIARQRLPPASSTVMVAPLSGATGATLPEAIADALRKAGFAVTTNSAQTAGAHSLLYRVTPFDGQMLLRVSIDATMTAQVFGANAKGQLAPASPQSVQTGAGP